jgi:hypothetical protein
VTGERMLTSCAQVVLGGLLIRCPHISFAKEAYEQLHMACDLYARAAPGYANEKGHVSRVMPTREGF